MVKKMSETLARKQGVTESEADDCVAGIQKGVGRMESLIADLLEYSRVAAEQNRYPHQPVSLDGPLAEALWSLQTAIKESGAEVAYAALPSVVADPRLIYQAFQNLIGNAIKYRGERRPLIQIAAKRQLDDWLISVSDNGIGIPMKYAERIFGVFQRLHSSDEYPGTGIGLAIVKRIIERHNGHIWVESEVGVGSTFFFTLPAAE